MILRLRNLNFIQEAAANDLPEVFKQEGKILSGQGTCRLQKKLKITLLGLLQNFLGCPVYSSRLTLERTC